MGEGLMLLKHVGLACGTEDNADKFYQTLLGLKKSEAKTLPVDLSRAIFGVEAELKIINYMSKDLHCEVFISGRIDSQHRQIAHLCLEVGDLSEFLHKCRSLGVEVSRIPKGDRFLTFVRDFDGNLFEIKGAMG
jgi:catechol 2,3-dioxygenase-like lactoylglutathione lyase family enzyme